MRVDFESFDPDTRIVRVRSPVGTFSADWMGDRDPDPGDWSYVEFSTEPAGVWGIDVTDAAPEEPDSISEDEDGWTFIGTVLGVESDHPDYAKGGRIIPPHDLEDGIFYVQIGDEGALMFAADGLDPDAPGRRVPVRQITVKLFPE